MRNALILIVLIVVIGAGVFAYTSQSHKPQGNTEAAQEQPIASVHYQCNAGKTIDADLYQGASKPSTAGEPPQPGGYAKVALSDGRTMTLRQTISADGARYSDGDPSKQGDETFVFWTKGNGALVLENNQEKSYIGCIQVVKDPGNLPQVYENGSQGFSIRYPANYTPDASYKYAEMGPGNEISGAKFTVASSTAAGTNLASDSYVSVEEIPNTTVCSAKLFLDDPRLKVSDITDGSIDYSLASSTGAGAGNRYEEWVYAVKGTNPCIAVRYMIHYGVIENYPAGAVKEFDHASLLQTFDQIRRTLVVAQ